MDVMHLVQLPYADDTRDETNHRGVLATRSGGCVKVEWLGGGRVFFLRRLWVDEYSYRLTRNRNDLLGNKHLK